MSGIMSMLLGARTAIAVAVDEFFNRVTLLLPGNGTNGAQNNTFLDSSTNNFTITRNGNTTQGTFSPFSQTGWGNFFPGSDFLNTASDAAFAFGTGDFTIEAWVYTTVSSTQRVISVGTAGNFELLLVNTGSNVYLNFFNGTTDYGTTTYIVPQNQWTHIAVTRSSSNLRLFINGNLQNTPSSMTTNYSSNAAVYIGRYGAGSPFQYYNGYISNVRIVKGTAVYTSNFTPSTTPLTAITNTSLLTCQSNRFVDNSTNAFAITINGNPSVQAFSPFLPTTAYSAATVGGSGYFDGTGDYLSIANNAVFDLGTGDCTIEAWIYLPSLSSTQTIFTVFPSSIVTVTGYQLNVNSSTGYLALDTFISGTEQLITATSNPVVANQWTHVAYTRTSGTSRLFVNGSSCTFTGSISQAINTGGNTITIGQSLYPGFALPLTGYISNLRIVKGGSLYSANFTPSTSPFTTTVSAGTVSLLTNFTNAGITDATAKNVLETVGNAQISTTQSKFGGSSIAFDGNGDYLILPDSTKENLRFGTGDFTIEFWAWKSANGTSGFDTPISVGSTGNFNSGFAVELSASRGFCFLYDAAVRISFSLNPNDSTWHHYAVVRNGSTFALYRDGVQLTTATLTPTLGITGFANIANGANGTTFFNGYIDDLRVTRGFARYTANFTPPTAAFALQ
jgi:hypothetical protein